MFVALYEMRVKQGAESAFEAAWAEVTDAIARRRGSLGARLHRTEHQGVYVAYALWPCQDVYFGDEGRDSFTGEELRSRDLMNACLGSLRTVYRMQIVDDRLRDAPHADPPSRL